MSKGNVTTIHVGADGKMEKGAGKKIEAAVKKMLAPITKKSKRNLRCKFTNDELLVVGKELAEANNALTALENDKARVVSDFAAKIKGAEAIVSIASNKISTGYEFRDVPVTIAMHEPESGKKTIVRDDTKEIVEVLDMTQDELQPELLEEQFNPVLP